MGKATSAMLRGLMTLLVACGMIVCQDPKPANPPAKADSRPSEAKDKDPPPTWSPDWSSSSASIPHDLRRPRTGPLHLIDVETGEVR